jgi:hypothetical protein
MRLAVTKPQRRRVRYLYLERTAAANIVGKQRCDQQSTLIPALKGCPCSFFFYSRPAGRGELVSSSSVVGFANDEQTADGIPKALASRGCGMAPDDQRASPMTSHGNDPAAEPLIELVLA